MSSFFTGSLLDDYILTKEKFETVVGTGSSKATVRKIFCLGILRWANEDTYGLDVIEYCNTPESIQHLDFLLDKWCLETYGIPYASAYELLQEATINHFEDLMIELGIRGNPSAIAIANEVIRKKESSGVVTVNFVNTLPLETEQEQENEQDN